MKKILSLLTLALLGAATPVFADFNFEILWQNYDHNVYEGYDGMYYTIKATANPKETGKIFLADIFNAPRSPKQSEVLNNVIVWGKGTEDDPFVRVKITDFGYTRARQGMSGVTSFEMTSASASASEPNPGDVVKLDSKNPLMHSIATLDPTEPPPAVRNGYYLGEFKDGDEIQVYLRAVLVDENGKEIENSAMEVTSNNPDGEYNSKFGTRTDQVDFALNGNSTKLQIAQLYLQGQLPFVILGVKDNGDYVYGSSKEVDWVPSQGAPLPGGVTIALIAGLFGLGFWYVRRRKAVIA